MWLYVSCVSSIWGGCKAESPAPGLQNLACRTALEYRGGKYLHWKASLLKKNKIVISPKLCCGSHLPNEDLPKAALEWQSSKGPPRELRESSRKAFCCLSHRILLWVSQCNRGTEHSLTLHCSESRGDEWYHPPWVTALPPVAFLEDPKTMVQVWVSN